MIKKIKNFICKLLGIKKCACSEDMDPHEELMLHVPEPEIPLYNHKLEKIRKLAILYHIVKAFGINPQELNIYVNRIRKGL